MQYRHFNALDGKQISREAQIFVPFCMRPLELFLLMKVALAELLNLIQPDIFSLRNGALAGHEKTKTNLFWPFFETPVCLRTAFQGPWGSPHRGTEGSTPTPHKTPLAEGGLGGR